MMVGAPAVEKHPNLRHNGTVMLATKRPTMQKPKGAFHQAVMGGLRSDGVLSADGPYITTCTIAENRPAGGVTL